MQRDLKTAKKINNCKKLLTTLNNKSCIFQDRSKNPKNNQKKNEKKNKITNIFKKTTKLQKKKFLKINLKYKFKNLEVNLLYRTYETA